MKVEFSSSIPVFALLLSLESSAAAQNDDALTKKTIHDLHRIKYDALLNLGDTTSAAYQQQKNSFSNALSEHGIVSVTDVPGYAQSLKDTMQHLHACAMDSSSDGNSKEHTFSDGTVRRTMATFTIPGPGGQQTIPSVHTDTDACRAFTTASDQLRESVAGATEAFSIGLGSVIDGVAELPLLSTPDGEYDFNGVKEVVENGDHLEHFHSYQHVDDTGTAEETTIDMHIDQGLFIAFAPALVVSAEGNTDAKPRTSSNDFYIQLEDGSNAIVAFGDDDLVFMLGDGVNQVINPKIHKLSEKKPLLRATPHGLSMSDHAKDEARVWYGRMVLPPSGAAHPEHGETFGNMRNLMIEESTSGNQESSSHRALAMGCSGEGVMARQLEEATCEEGSTYCWHRCMLHEEQGISIDHCASRNLMLQCINPREQVYVSGHGDFYPACTNSTENATDYPTVPGYPRDEDECNAERWAEFSTTDGYQHVTGRLGDNRGQRGWWEGASQKGGGNVTKFMWNVVGDEIEGRIAFNGMFGYLSLGFANITGAKNGMNGASVIMAIPGGGYTAKFGLDYSFGESVDEYHIHPTGSSFRHWMTPIPGRDTSSYVVEYDECFTALSFKTNTINGIKFNATGVDSMVWAGNPKDTFCGSHGRGTEGRGDRDRFEVEWSTGRTWFLPEMEVEEEMEVTDDSKQIPSDTVVTDDSEREKIESGAASATSNSIIAIILSVVVGLVATSTC
jgi:hypothetical protein